MGPFAPEVYRAPAPYPYRGISTEDALAGLDWMFKATVDPASVACVILEPIQGEGGFTVMPPEFIQGLKERCERTASSTSTTRCSPAWAAPARCGGSSTRASCPT